MDFKKLRSDISKSAPVYRDDHHAQVTSVLADGDVPYTDHEMDADERVIMALGYKQEFKREFSLWTTFCVSFAVLGLLPSFASTLYYGMHPISISSWPIADLVQKGWVTQEQLVWCGDGLLP